MRLQGFRVAYEPCQDYGERGGDILDSSSSVRLQYLLGPGSLDEVRVDDLVPALLTLHVAAVREVLGDQLPALVELLDLLLQQLVLQHSVQNMINGAADTRLDVRSLIA